MIRPPPMSRLALALVVAIAGCASAGPYGYAAQYAPSSEEETSVTGAREYDPVMYAREPDVWRKSKVVLFGIVTSRAPGPGGAAYVTLSVRKLETRNLCSNGLLWRCGVRAIPICFATESKRR